MKMHWKMVFFALWPLGQALGFALPALSSAAERDVPSRVAMELSETMTEAGGIGGLLAVMDHNGSGTVTDAHFCSYDGNGNVTALTRASDSQMTARYEYSPFGELIRSTGPLARGNPFRFSTKFQDEESGLVYYGYRYYYPSFDRWISRDPAAENGGMHLYMFAKNSPIQTFDPDGRTPQDLLALVGIGGLANLTAGMFHSASFTGLPGLGKLAYTKTMAQAMAAVNTVAIDRVLGGRLLQNVGGPLVFGTYFAGGAGLGTLPHHQFHRQQSLVKAVVAGRPEAVAAIGAAAAQAFAGTGPNFGERLSEAAYGFLQSARRGDTAYADLDAALMGSAIMEYQLHALDKVAGLLFDLLNRDAAAAFSRLPSYNALNAWDMAVSMEDLLEGM